MTVYHGGFSTVRDTKILQPSHSMDFGAGFYTTTDFDQAKKWSLIKKDRFGYEKAVVSSYNFDNEIFTDPELLCKIFRQADEEWLDFVIANRQDINFKSDYDIVMGAVANDNVYASINLFEEGFLSKAELLEELMTWKYVDQICFRSEKALQNVKFIRSVEVAE